MCPLTFSFYMTTRIRFRVILPSGVHHGVNVDPRVSTAKLAGLVATKAGMQLAHLLIRFRGAALPAEVPLTECGFALDAFNDLLVAVRASSLALRVEGRECAHEVVVSRVKMGSYMLTRGPSKGKYQLLLKSTVMDSALVVIFDICREDPEKPWAVFLGGGKKPPIARGFDTLDAVLQHAATYGLAIGTRIHKIGTDPCPSCATLPGHICKHCRGTRVVPMPPCGPPIGFNESAALQRAATLAGSAIVDFAGTLGPVLDATLCAIFGRGFALAEIVASEAKWATAFGALANPLRTRDWHIANLCANAGMPSESGGDGPAAFAAPADSDALLTMLYQTALMNIRARTQTHRMERTPEHVHAAVLRGAVRILRHAHIPSTRASPTNQSRSAVPAVGATREEVAQWLAFTGGASDGLALTAGMSWREDRIGRCAMLFYDREIDGRKLYALRASAPRTWDERWWHPTAKSLAEIGLKSPSAETFCTTVQAAARQPVVIDADIGTLARDPAKPDQRPLLPPPERGSAAFVVETVRRPRGQAILKCTVRLPNLAPMQWGPADAYGYKYPSVESQMMLAVTTPRSLLVTATASVSRERHDPMQATAIVVYRQTHEIASNSTATVNFEVVLSIKNERTIRRPAGAGGEWWESHVALQGETTARERTRVYSGPGVPAQEVRELASAFPETVPTARMIVSVTEGGVPVMPALYYPAF